MWAESTNWLTTPPRIQPDDRARFLPVSEDRVEPIPKRPEREIPLTNHINPFLPLSPLPSGTATLSTPPAAGSPGSSVGSPSGSGGRTLLGSSGGLGSGSSSPVPIPFLPNVAHPFGPIALAFGGAGPLFAGGGHLHRPSSLSATVSMSPEREDPMSPTGLSPRGSTPQSSSQGDGEGRMNADS